jgi:hydrogenase expression/formation protein HypC
MCLAVPGRLLAVEGEDPVFRQGRVDFAGIRKTVSLAYTPEARVGDYVLVHVGFALQVIDEEEAQRNLATLEELMAELHEAPG